MSLNKQAKTLSKKQIDLVRLYLKNRRNFYRNDVIFLLSVKAGLRAKEIANLKWSHIIDSDMALSNQIALPNIASKGNSGRHIPINKDLKSALITLYEIHRSKRTFNVLTDNVIQTERSKSTSPQVIVNFFQSLYKQLNLANCSSHSGRRTFITNVARKISTVGGSMRDVQMLAGHTSLSTTQRYIEGNNRSKIEVVDLI